MNPLTPKPSDLNITSTLENNNDDPNTIYYCNYCNARLHYQSTDQETGKRIFLCLKCNIEYIPANQLVKRSSRFETPQGPIRKLLTATIDGDLKASCTPYTDKRMKDLTRIRMRDLTSCLTVLTQLLKPLNKQLISKGNLEKVTRLLFSNYLEMNKSELLC